jgi:hypothetical protein
MNKPQGLIRKIEDEEEEGRGFDLPEQLLPIQGNTTEKCGYTYHIRASSGIIRPQ